jgi:hypothetical protein
MEACGLGASQHKDAVCVCEFLLQDWLQSLKACIPAKVSMINTLKQPATCFLQHHGGEQHSPLWLCTLITLHCFPDWHAVQICF